MKVLRTVGEAPAAVNGSERPVDEEPKVRGRAAVCRVSLGREAMVRSPVTQDMVVDGHSGRISEVGRTDMKHAGARREDIERGSALRISRCSRK